MNNLDSIYRLSLSVGLAALMVVIAAVGMPSRFGVELSPMTRAGAILVCLAIGWTLVGAQWYVSRRREQKIQQALHRLEQCGDDRNAALAFAQDASLEARFGSLGKDLARLGSQRAQFAEQIEEAERSRALAEVRSQTALGDGQSLTDVVNQLEDPVMVVDRYDEVVFANQQARDLYCWEEEKIEGTIDQKIPQEELVDAIKQMRRRKSKSQRRIDLEIPNAEGELQYFRALVRGQDCSKNSDDSSTSSGVVALLRNVSGERVIQKRNSEFVAAASHEMKTPLAGIRAYVELLQDGDAENEETREEFLEVINSQADRLQRLIHNLLNLARIEAGVVEVDKRKQSVNDLLEEAVRVVQYSAEEKKIELVSDLSPMHMEAYLDRDMILQAAINLLSNAIKYTSPGGKVTLRSRTNDDEVQFEVTDTGVGLSPEDVQNVFKKFYRVSKDSHMAAGTGLGLPLAQHIVEDVHGGVLSLQSELGEGSTFAIALPATRNMAPMATH